MPHTYILYSEVLDKYYIGSTDMEPKERLKRHLTNHGGFTSKAKDWRIVYSKCHNSTSEARAHESKIKKAKSRKFIEALITSPENEQSG